MYTKYILVALILIFPNLTFKTYDNGQITFSMPIYVSKIEFKENFTVFHDIKIGKQTWGALGFACNEDTSINIFDSKNDKLFLNLNSKGVEVSVLIYIENMDKPDRVKGVSDWGWADHVLSVSGKDNSIVSIIWGPPPSPVIYYPPPAPPPQSDPVNETEDIDIVIEYAPVNDTEIVDDKPLIEPIIDFGPLDESEEETMNGTINVPYFVDSKPQLNETNEDPIVIKPETLTEIVLPEIKLPISQMKAISPLFLIIFILSCLGFAVLGNLRHSL